jgi:sialidase-1
VYSGEYGGAITFDGTNDYGTTRSLTQLEMGNRSVTIGAWFRTTDATGAIATKRGTGSGYQLYIYSSGKLYADGYSTATGVNSASAINNNTVKYGVVVFDYTNSTIRLYINGVADNTASLSSGGNDTSAYFNIARSQQYTDHFAGTIYSVQVYNKALSATEILQNFNAGRGRFSL